MIDDGVFYALKSFEVPPNLRPKLWVPVSSFRTNCAHHTTRIDKHMTERDFFLAKFEVLTTRPKNEICEYVRQRDHASHPVVVIGDDKSVHLRLHDLVHNTDQMVGLLARHHALEVLHTDKINIHDCHHKGREFRRVVPTFCEEIQETFAASCS